MPTNIGTMQPVKCGTSYVPPKNTPGSNLAFGSRKKNKFEYQDNNSITCDKSNKRNKNSETNGKLQHDNANKQSQIRSVSPTPQNTNTLPDDNLILAIKISSQQLPHHVGNGCYEITSPNISGKDDIAVSNYTSITTHSMGVLENVMSNLHINRMDALMHLSMGAATFYSCSNNTKSTLDDNNAKCKALVADMLTLMTYRLDSINNKQEGDKVDVESLLDMMKDLHMKERNVEDDISSSDNINIMDMEEGDSSSSILSRPSTFDPITDNNNDSQEEVLFEASTEEVGADETAGNNDSFDMESTESNNDTNTRVEGSSVASGEMTDADDEGISNDTAAAILDESITTTAQDDGTLDNVPQVQVQGRNDKEWKRKTVTELRKIFPDLKLPDCSKTISQYTPDEQQKAEQTSLLFALGRHSSLPEDLLEDLMRLVDMGYVFFHGQYEDEMNVICGYKKKRKKKGLLPEDTVAILESRFNIDNLYPSKEQKEAFAVESGLSYDQVDSWLKRRRKKLGVAGRKAAGEKKKTNPELDTQLSSKVKEAFQVVQATVSAVEKVRQEKEARQAEVSARMDAEEKEKRAKEEQAEKEKRAAEKERRLLQDKISNLLLQGRKKELADLKEKASLVYHKYVELGRDIKRLSGNELTTLVKYICKVEGEDTFSRHCDNKTSMKERLEKCTPSWTSYFTRKD